MQNNPCHGRHILPPVGGLFIDVGVSVVYRFNIEAELNEALAASFSGTMFAIKSRFT
jgi:hypothetical protein